MLSLFVGMAVAFCTQINARELILTHFSQRYKRTGEDLEPGETSIDKLVGEAEEAFKDRTQDSNSNHCTVSAADDFKTYTIYARK